MNAQQVQVSLAAIVIHYEIQLRSLQSHQIATKISGWEKGCLKILTILAVLCNGKDYG